MKKEQENRTDVRLPKDLCFAGYGQDCSTCKYQNGGKVLSSKVWCEKYKTYYYPEEGASCSYYERR